MITETSLEILSFCYLNANFLFAEYDVFKDYRNCN